MSQVISRRPTLDEAVEYAERRSKACREDGNSPGADALDLLVDFLKNARYDIPALVVCSDPNRMGNFRPRGDHEDWADGVDAAAGFLRAEMALPASRSLGEIVESLEDLARHYPDRAHPSKEPVEILNQSTLHGAESNDSG